MRIGDWSSDVCSSDLMGFCDHLPMLSGQQEPVRCNSSLQGIGLPLQHQGIPIFKQRLARHFFAVFSVPFQSGQLNVFKIGFKRGDSSSLQGGLRHDRSEEHTSELQTLMRLSYAVFCLKKKN